MKLLLVSATRKEIEPFLDSFNLAEGPNEWKGNSIHILTGGVGMVATAYSMGRVFAHHHFDLAVNAGIAGSFQRSLSTGTVVQVSSDCFSELGAEDGPDFLTIDEMGFGNSTECPLTLEGLDKYTAHLRKVTAITVNSVHGNDTSISRILGRLKPEIESMEGAAFFYACRMCQIPSIQIRSISNFIERRNRHNWNIPLAVGSLNIELINLLRKILL